MTGSAWVIGESLIDIVDTPTGRTTAPGGSPRNVAFGLSRLGVATDFSTRVGNDRHGEMIVRDLTSAGVAVAHGSVTRGRTSTATARIDPGGNATYEFDIQWDWERSRPPSTAAVVHTGSIAAALGPGSDEVLSTFIELKGAGGARPLLSFDPNIRDSLIRSAALARARIDAFALLSDIVKMSHEDAEWLHPGLAPDTVVDTYLRAGAGLVAITLGADGCILATKHTRIRLPAATVPVVDTIGAGDAFMSGMLVSILRAGLDARIRNGDDLAAELKVIAKMALVCAQVTVTRAGAIPPTLGELAAALRQP